MPGYSDTPKTCTQIGLWFDWYRVGELDLFEHATIYRNAFENVSGKYKYNDSSLGPSSFCPGVALPHTSKYQIFAKLVELLNTVYYTNIGRILTPTQSTSDLCLGLQ